MASLLSQTLWTFTGKPHGWGAGANKGWGDTPTPRDPLTNHAWRLTNKNSVVAPSSSFNTRDTPSQLSHRSGLDMLEEVGVLVLACLCVCKRLCMSACVSTCAGHVCCQIFTARPKSLPSIVSLFHLSP